MFDSFISYTTFLSHFFYFFFFFFNDTATTEIYTLSLHDALPISPDIDVILALYVKQQVWITAQRPGTQLRQPEFMLRDRKSTRLNSSHANISYAVFCLKKKKNI